MGGILSVTLFSLKVISLAKNLLNDMQGSLHVDDFVLCVLLSQKHEFY